EGCPGRPAGGCRRGKRWRSRRGRRRRVRRRTDDGGPARGAGPPFVCVLVVGGRGLGASTVRPHKGAVCPGARLMRAGGRGPASAPAVRWHEWAAVSPGARLARVGGKSPSGLG